MHTPASNLPLLRLLTMQPSPQPKMFSQRKDLGGGAGSKLALHVGILPVTESKSRDGPAPPRSPSLQGHGSCNGQDLPKVTQEGTGRVEVGSAVLFSCRCLDGSRRALSTLVIQQARAAQSLPLAELQPRAPGPRKRFLEGGWVSFPQGLRLGGAGGRCAGVTVVRNAAPS